MILNAGNRDFTKLLDELMASATIEEAPRPAATPSVDYLTVAEELGHISITPDQAQAEYTEMAEETPPLEPVLEDVVTIGFLPSTEPEEIERELCIDRIELPQELDRIRRDFAYANHPDRMEPHLRDRAELRMQIANQLIDEAKRRLVTAAH